MSDQPTSPQKICVLCGQDCAGQPRIKDPKGHYYHKACHEQAMREREQRLAQEPASGPRAFDEPAPFPIAEPEASSAPAETGDESVIPPATGGQGCPSCGHPIAPEAVLCTNCGYNLMTGESVASSPLSEVAAPPSRAGDRRTWPAVIGIISIVVGGGGALLYAASLVGAVMQQSERGATGIVGAIIAVGLPLALAVWLLKAGIGVLRRQQTAAVSIRRWALTKTILYGTCFALSLGLTVLASGMIARMQEEMGAEGAELGIGLMVAGLVVSFGFVLAWPIFILIWFGRDAIQEQIGRWH
jgi:hypothetical protein